MPPISMTMVAVKTFNPFSNQLRKQITTLYRSKLRLAKQMGYSSKLPINTDLINSNFLSNKRLLHLAKKRNCGQIVWTNVRHQYKYTLERFDNEPLALIETTDAFLDYGFEMLRRINCLRDMYVKENYYRREGMKKLNLREIIPSDSIIWDGPSG